jgi:Domain of Unknown Function (DUF1206)
MATTRSTTLGQAEALQAVRQVARRPWLERLARFGLVARGAVYALIGVLAVQAAVFGHGTTTDTRGALRMIAEQSRALLAAVAVGLAGYALWRLAEAVLDPEKKGWSLKGITLRLGMLGSSAIYSGLALGAVRAFRDGAVALRSSGDSGQRLAASALDKPFGRWLVALVGIGVIIGGIAQLVRAWRRSFEKHLMTAKMDGNERRLARRSGQLGLSARGVVFLISGIFLIQAAVRYDASRVRGLRGALDALAAQPHGQLLLGVVALGLVAFGAYSFLEARYRRIVF